MSRFVLIDNSLVEMGGHFFSHAVRVLHAAHDLGLDPVLATNRDFKLSREVPVEWPLYATFRYTALGRYSEFSVAAEGASGGENKKDRYWQRIRRSVGLRKRVRSFTRSCKDLFQRLPLESSDHVFLPFCTEISLLGLLRYMAYHPRAAIATWHLYYHSFCLPGRPPEWSAKGQQAVVMKQALRQAERLTGSIRINFYATTQHLCEGLNRLSRVRFSYLPYPVETTTDGSSRPSPSALPLRLVLAGQPRSEKGAAFCGELITSLWDRGLAAGELQLRLQQRPGAASLDLAPELHRAMLNRDPAAVEVASYPLSARDYREFLRSADIGLLMYDSAAYYARISSVMLEFLCSGVPVIVPAGCWMGEVVAEANAQYLERVSRDWKPIAFEALPVGAAQRTDLRCRVTGDGDDLQRMVKRGGARVPAGASVWLPTFRWEQPKSRGTYVCLELQQTDRCGNTLDRWSVMLHHRDSTPASPALFRLHKEAWEIHWSMRDAYAEIALPPGQLDAKFFGTDGVIPWGAIGLTAIDRSQIADLVSEISNHHRHYRESARTYGNALRLRHTVAEHLSQLVDPVYEADARHCA